jgi:hypothetical protein
LRLARGGIKFVGNGNGRVRTAEQNYERHKE